MGDFRKASGGWDFLDHRCRSCRNRRYKKHHDYPSVSQFRVPYNDSGEKWCSGCRTWKSPVLFGRNKRGWDGLTSQCRGCGQRSQARSLSKPDVRERRTEYQKMRKRENVNARLRNNLSCRIHTALRRRSLVKSERMTELVGCSVGKLKGYLEGLWQRGMTWQNHGRDGWHIDHVLPCASFDLSKLEEQKRCFHYTNLQPMWGRENMAKGKKILVPEAPRP